MKLTIDTRNLSPKANEVFNALNNPKTGTNLNPNERATALLEGVLLKVGREGSVFDALYAEQTNADAKPNQPQTCENSWLEHGTRVYCKNEAVEFPHDEVYGRNRRYCKTCLKADLEPTRKTVLEITPGNHPTT